MKLTRLANPVAGGGAPDDGNQTILMPFNATAAAFVSSKTQASVVPPMCVAPAVQAREYPNDQ
jgi:hypothetical protein